MHVWAEAKASGGVLRGSNSPVLTLKNMRRRADGQSGGRCDDGGRRVVVVVGGSVCMCWAEGGVLAEA